MKETKRNTKICNSCYNRLDCDIRPFREDWCVYFMKDEKIHLQEKKDQNLTDTIEMGAEEIKSLLEKLS